MNHKEHRFSNPTFVKTTSGKLDLPKVRQNQEHKKLLRASLLLAHQERSTVRVFGNAVNDLTKTMTTVQKGFAFSSLALAIIVGAAGVLGPSAYSVANAEAQETINRAYARLAHFSDEERAGLYKKAHGEGTRMAFRNHDSAALADILAEAQAAPDLQIVSADEVPIHGFFGRAGRAFGFKMVHKVKSSEKKLMWLPEGVREEAKGHVAIVGEHKKPTTFMVYTNAEGKTIYLGINEDDEPVFVLVTNGEFPKEGEDRRMIIRSENEATPEDGKRMYLKSEGDTLPGGEGKVLYDENGNMINAE